MNEILNSRYVWESQQLGLEITQLGWEVLQREILKKMGILDMWSSINQIRISVVNIINILYQVEDRIAEIDVKIELLYSARNKNNIHV
jgi:hypothetical protein